MSARSPAQPKSLSKLQHELLFWGHFGLWLLAVISPFIFPLSVLVIGFGLYVAHLLIFKGCVITIWQRHHGQVEPGQEYYQALIKRLFNYHLSDGHTFILSRGVELYVLVTAVLVNR